MLADAISAIRSRMTAGFTAWPVKWPNETLGGNLSQGGPELGGPLGVLGDQGAAFGGAHRGSMLGYGPI